LIGAGFAIYRDPTLVRKGFALVVRQFHVDHHPAGASDRSAALSPPSTAETPAKTEESQSSPVDSALEGTSTPPPANPQEQTGSSAGSQPASNASDSDKSRKTMTERAIAQTGQAIADGLSSIESAGAIRVNPSVMDENLIVQRVPAYPESAKISGVEGDVIMDALISKEGTVKRVHVMEGDSRLRSAAEEAVYKWRYRPYVLHGKPVEVATTVTVNFNLDRR
jgi:TonB family protein